jgi:hypothetical protein
LSKREEHEQTQTKSAKCSAFRRKDTLTGLRLIENFVCNCISQSAADEKARQTDQAQRCSNKTHLLILNKALTKKPRAISRVSVIQRSTNGKNAGKKVKNHSLRSFP